MDEIQLDKTLTMCDILNRLSHLPDLLRARDEGDEAENLDCLIESIKAEAVTER